ncbi:MAG: phosphoenolpyruvate--protein phosphotransferase, partial [Deltaproteobacteria bacterium]|nr:phosphoenolpyruvate--protein phosphotransferase [Deltaproteobacteria bacterium]
ADLEDLRQRVLEHLIEKKRGRKKSFKMEGVLVADTLVPSDTAVLDPECIQAIVTARGGLTSHAAILARSMGIPAVMGVAGLLSKIKPGDLLIVDGQAGKVFLNPERKILLEYEKQQERLADEILKLQAYAAQPAQTLDGHSIKVMANVGIASDLKKLPYYGAEGVGLYRTEFPFVSRKTLPNEEEQFHLYRQVIEEAKGLPVTFRILDAGGDKPIEGLGIPVEANPFLGYRSIRLFFKRPEILEIQFRALLRASTSGPISILVPMITGLEDIRVVKAILEKSKQDLKRQKISFDSHIPLGIMIEVPSAVQLSHLLIQEADYFSIGTNDLIQYTLAVDRNNERVASFFEPLHPAVLASIARVAEVARNAKKSVGICGEIAGNSELAPLFVGFGINHLSMIVTNIPSLKKTIREMNYEKAKVLAEKVLREDTVEGVKVLLHDYWEK